MAVISAIPTLVFSPLDAFGCQNGLSLQPAAPRKVLQHGFDNQMIHADAWTKLKATKRLG